MIIASYRNLGIFTKQTLLIVVGLFISLVANIISTFSIGGFTVNIHIISISVTIICLAFACLRFRFMTTLPISLRQVVDLISDGYLIIDDNQRILSYNKALRQMFPGFTYDSSHTNFCDFLDQSLLNITYDRFLEVQAEAVTSQETIIVETNALNNLNVSMEITPVLRYKSHIGSIILLKNSALSMTDQLTGIANRRNFDNRLNTEWERAIRGSSSISLMIIDVDHFKNYNDTYGHQQGDVALKTVGKVLSESVKRPTDFAARWGGEEFVALLPNTDKEGSIIIAEQVRKSVEDAVIFCEDSMVTNVTVSIGICSINPTFNDSIEEFVSKADQALYIAKNEGRNRAVFFSDIKE